MKAIAKDQLIIMVSQKMRLLRNEYHFTQEKMADIIGISKKTLVQIEKDRMLASWTVVIAICGLFRESDILKMTLGDDPIEIIEAISFENTPLPKQLTGGGKMFWKTIEKQGKFKIQRNIFSNHLRIIDGHGKRWISSYNKDIIQQQFKQLIESGESDAKETQ